MPGVYSYYSVWDVKLANDGISMIVTSSEFTSYVFNKVSSSDIFYFVNSLTCTYGTTSGFYTRKGRSSSFVSLVKATPLKYLMRHVLPELQAPTTRMHLPF